ncbi:MAG TPA: DUF5689 domain-containing protein [Chitinophagaceae bacterium]|nr:DUF5689 domain-containing protein [Chitinophagaceae bacterium]HMU60083.1 DUF5689 domain-containing protein [Chitinophagaceae bacterium]
MLLKNKNSWLPKIAIFVSAAVVISACQKTFNDPPVIGEPDIVANTTIKDVKARYTSGAPVAITDNVVIEGVVNCDDKSGNYYQQIAIQDSTGGVLLRLAGNNHYNNYPVGRKIYVKLKGLYLGQYNGTLQFGGGVDSAYISQGGVTLLAVNLQDQHIIKGPLNQPLEPKLVTVSQLTTTLQDKYISTLIKLSGYEFSSGDRSKNYADDGFSGNRIIQDCSNLSANKITVRTSNYSNFATLPVAQGNGDIIAVYSYFGSTKQLTIRDTTDVRFYGSRCPTASGDGQIILSSSPQSYNFDNIGTAGLPIGVYVKEGASSSYIGNEGFVYQTNFNTGTAWNQTSAGFKNFASATGLTSTASTTVQTGATNRSLGYRQTSSFGDPGAAFAFLLANTTGKTNLQLEFKLQSLDAPATAGRTTTWRVDYATGLNPPLFSTVTTSPAPITTVNGTFSNNTVTVNFGSLLNNISQPVWIRIVTLAATTGGGNRPSTGIDDVKFTWN